MLQLFVCCLILVSLAGQGHSGSPCPPSNDIIPCKCEKPTPQTTQVGCVYHDQKILEKAITKMSDDGMIIDEFTIESSGLTFMNTSFYKDVSVRSVTIVGPRLNSIEDYAFEGQQNSLEEVRVSSTRLTEVPLNALSILENLRSLTLMRSEVTRIPEKAFDKFQSTNSLSDLILADNYIGYIGAEAFKSLANLNELDLSGNKIQKLPAGILPPNNRLTKFIVRKNRLEKISGDIDTFQEDALLDFSNNQIKTVSGLALRTMIEKNLVVELDTNPLVCGCAMRILTTSDEETFISGTCNAPEKLAGRKLQNLTAKDYATCFFLRLLAKL